MAEDYVILARDPDTGEEHRINFTQGTVEGLRDGKLVKMDLGPSDVHIDTPLAGYAVGYKPEAGVADAVMPVVQTPNQSDKYYVHEPDDIFQLQQGAAASPTGQVMEVGVRHSSSTFTTKAYALKTVLHNVTAANADPAIMLQQRLAMKPIADLLRLREYRVATAVTTAGSFASANKVTCSGTTKWNGGTGSDPLADIHAICEASLQPITDMVMNERVFNAFQRNAQVQKYIYAKDAPPPQVDRTDSEAAMLSSLLKLPRIHVAKQKYKSAASTYSYVFPDSVALYRLPPVMPPVGESISWNTFRWSGAASMIPDSGAATVPGTGPTGGFCVRSFYNPLRGLGGTRDVVAFHFDVDTIIDTTCAGLIINAWQ